MKKIIFSLLLMGFCLQSYAIDKQELADTLSSIVSQHAYAGKVAVSRIRVRNQQIFVHTNATLSHISFTPQEVRDIRLLVSQLVLGNNQGKVSIYSGDLELGELITSVHKARPANMRYTLNQVPAWVRNVSLPYSAPNGLSGKHIALWGSHGRYYHQTMEQWLWQRAKLWTTVEDVYTSSYTMPFLVPMLENAGAVVVQPRERDTQAVEDVVDEIEAMRREGERAPHDAGVIGDPAEAIRQEEKTPLWWAIAKVIGGLAVLIVSCDLFVDNAVAVARSFGVNDAFISLTLIACGTSLPELAASVVAAFKKNTQLALGNIVGSNIFNILLILGVSSQVMPLTSAGITWVDYVVMIAAAAFPLLFGFRGKIGRVGGAVMVLCFALYTWYLMAGFLSITGL